MATFSVRSSVQAARLGRLFGIDRQAVWDAAPAPAAGIDFVPFALAEAAHSAAAGVRLVHDDGTFTLSGSDAPHRKATVADAGDGLVILGKGVEGLRF